MSLTFQKQEEMVLKLLIIAFSSQLLFDAISAVAKQKEFIFCSEE